MPKFALRYPFFIIMMCLVVMLIGVVNIASMPVDLFPKIDMPVVVVALATVKFTDVAADVYGGYPG